MDPTVEQDSQITPVNPIILRSLANRISPQTDVPVAADVSPSWDVPRRWDVSPYAGAGIPAARVMAAVARAKAGLETAPRTPPAGTGGPGGGLALQESGSVGSSLLDLWKRITGQTGAANAAGTASPLAAPVPATTSQGPSAAPAAAVAAPAFALEPKKELALKHTLQSKHGMTEAEADHFMVAAKKTPGFNDILTGAMDKEQARQLFHQIYRSAQGPTTANILDVMKLASQGDANPVAGGQSFNPGETGLCSSAVRRMLKGAGYDTSRFGATARDTEAGLRSAGLSVSDYQHLLPGDVVALNRVGHPAGHVGLYAGNGQLWHEWTDGLRLQPLREMQKYISGFYHIPTPEERAAATAATAAR